MFDKVALKQQTFTGMTQRSSARLKFNIVFSSMISFWFLKN